MKKFLFSAALVLFSFAAQTIGESISYTGISPVQAVEPRPPRESARRADSLGSLSDWETKAIEAEKNGMWEDAGFAYFQASRAARTAGQLQKAMAYGNKAMEIGERIKDPGIQGSAIFQLSLNLRQLGQDEKARELVLKGIEITKQMSPGPRKEITQANLYSEMGFSLIREGKNEEAIDYMTYALRAQESALAFLEKVRQFLPDPEVIPRVQSSMLSTLFRLGTAYTQAKNAAEAIKTFERGLAFIQESGLKVFLEANLLWGLGSAYAQKGELPRALETLAKALKTAEDFQNEAMVQAASGQIGRLLLQTGRAAEAVPYYKKSIDSVESVRSLLESEEFRSSFFEDKRRIYAGMIVALLQAGDQGEAFSYSERARSRAFLDILGSKVQLARSGTLLEHERALQARVSVLRALIADQGTDSPGRERLRKEFEEAQKAYNDFLTKVRSENKEQASLMNVEPFTLKQVQELLEPGVTLLEYFVVEQQALLWVVERDRLRFVRIPVSRNDLVAKVTALRDTMYQVAEKEQSRQYSQELYRLLIEPALPHIQGKELLIIPHDVLHYLPFQALASDKGRYLIQDYPIYYLSSASLMQFTREKRRAGKEGKEEKALVMGNPSLGDEAYNLRFAEREAKEVVRVYPKSAVYLRSKATKSRAVSLSPEYDILHFAVHGELNQDDPLSSGLLLVGEGKEGGKLKASEIFSLNLKADTVVLSACETGLGKITNGDEIIGLTRAFLYAGAPSVITTLWKVNDRASYELMREFYANLKTLKKSEALRQAQLKIMKEFPQPFFWAAYELNGEP